MDLKEIKSLKQKLEFDILHLLTEFSKNTGVSVDSLRIEGLHGYTCSGDVTIIYNSITVEAKI